MISIIISLIVIIISIFAYRHSINVSKDNRINSVVDGYFKLAHNHPMLDSGISAFKKAGICNLKNDKEIKEAIIKVANREQKHPLGKYEEMILDVKNVKEFFMRWDSTKTVELLIKEIDTGQ